MRVRGNGPAPFAIAACCLLLACQTGTPASGGGAATGGGGGGSTAGGSGGRQAATGGAGAGPAATGGIAGDGTGGRGAAGGAAAGHAGGGAGSGGAGLAGTSGASGGTTAAGGRGGAGGAVAPSGGKSWFPQDLTFTSTSNKANPYMDVTDFKVTFTGPDGAKLTLPGFYVGNQTWKVRFAPTGPGTFTYVTSSAQDPSLNGLRGTAPAAVANPAGHGALVTDPALPHQLLYEDGSRYFPMGYEVDWLALMDFGDANITKAKTLIDIIAANGFTEVNLQVYGYDTSWKAGKTSAYDFGPTAQFPWVGTNAAPDNTRMNEAFWQNYDRVIAYLFEKGLNAHIFCKFVRTYGADQLVGWPAKGSPEDDLYFRFLVARYQAYSNVVWDAMKESYQEPDQVYLADRLTFIRANDAYRRLRTLHDSDGGQSQYKPNYYDVAAHRGTFELYTDQQTSQYAAAVAALKARALPYLNAEVTQYQIGNDGTYAYKGQSKEAVFATNLEVLMAGGFFSYYYSLQAWDIVRWNETPDGIGWYKNLISFMKTTGWFDMTASDGLIGGGAIGRHCLANPGKEYIVFAPGSAAVVLDVAGAAAPLSARWLDLYTGKAMALAAQGNGSHTFTNPYADPAFLYLSQP